MKLKIGPNEPVNVIQPGGEAALASVSQNVSLKSLPVKNFKGSIKWTSEKTGRSSQFFWDGKNFFTDINFRATYENKVAGKLFGSMLWRFGKDATFSMHEMLEWGRQIKEIAERTYIHEGGLWQIVNQPMLKVYHGRQGGYQTSLVGVDACEDIGGSEVYHFSPDELDDARLWVSALKEMGGNAYFGSIERDGYCGRMYSGRHLDAFQQAFSLIKNFRDVCVYHQQGAKINSVSMSALTTYFRLADEMGFQIDGQSVWGRDRFEPSRSSDDDCIRLMYVAANLVAEMRESGKTNFPKYSTAFERQLRRFDFWLSENGYNCKETLMDVVREAEPTAHRKTTPAISKGSDNEGDEVIAIKFI